eukprot:c19613_g1_i3.p1 GENE.c19613_g1_i3~~c19613_g1_i3.p1  ORF type:complete len:319 (+),score=23.70 c19613_g1_i3:304-1260(+)
MQIMVNTQRWLDYQPPTPRPQPKEDSEKSGSYNQASFDYSKTDQVVHIKPTLPDPDIEIEVPEDERLRAIIERTANFITEQGAEKEEAIRVRQCGNPNFSFLFPEGQYHAYYKHRLTRLALSNDHFRESISLNRTPRFSDAAPTPDCDANSQTIPPAQPKTEPPKIEADPDDHAELGWLQVSSRSWLRIQKHPLLTRSGNLPWISEIKRGFKTVIQTDLVRRESAKRPIRVPGLFAHLPFGHGSLPKRTPTNFCRCLPEKINSDPTDESCCGFSLLPRLVRSWSLQKQQSSSSTTSRRFKSASQRIAMIIPWLFDFRS